MSIENDEILAEVAQVKALFGQIKTDVGAIIAKLPAAGGLTADEVVAIKAALTDAIAAGTDTEASAHTDTAQAAQ